MRRAWDSRSETVTDTLPPNTPSDALVPGLATQANRPQRYLAAGLMSLAALFSGVLIGVMIAAYLADLGPGYPQSAAMKEIRAILDKDPRNEPLKTALANEDARIRQAFEARRQKLASGAWMLLVGLVVFAASARWYVALDAKLPRVRKAAEIATDAPPRVSPRALGWVTLAAVGAAAVIALVIFRQWVVPTKTAEASTYKDNWPSFRGPTGSGLVGPGHWPAEWDAKTGLNIAWKTELPLAGKGSPIVWGDKVFVTAASDKDQKIVCLDRATGRIDWQVDVKSLDTVERTSKGEGATTFEDTGWAAPTPVTDGRRVYALFATGDIAAVDYSGKVAWIKNFGKPESAYGLSASLAFAKDTIIFQFDQGDDPEKKLSAILGLDPATGAVVWRTERPVSGSWSSPIAAQTPKGPVVLTTGVPLVIAYNPADGAELWRCDGLSGDVAPSPIYVDGVVYVTGENAKAMAIRAGGEGDVTATNVLWTTDNGLSDASSPLCDGRFFLQATSGGYVTCSDASNGKTLWEHRYPGVEFWSSPALAGGVVYLAGSDGVTRLMKLGPAFEAVRDNAVGEAVYATPAFADGQIFIRGEKHLFCIAAKK